MAAVTTAETEEAVPTVGGAEVKPGAPDTLTTHQDKPVMSIGPMGRGRGSVLIVITVPGGITSHPDPRTIETSWRKLK